MNISEPAAVEQQRAVPRGLFARSLACACLMLMALASRDLAAQGAMAAVTFQSGEFTKEVPMPRFATQFGITLPPYVCQWPTTDAMRSRISSMNGARLWTVLGQMEYQARQVHASEAIPIIMAMDVLMGPGVVRSAKPGPGQSYFYVAVPPPSQTNISLPVLIGCLEANTARAGLHELFRIIRAYLGMESLAPTKPTTPTKFELPPSTPARIAPTNLQ